MLPPNPANSSGMTCFVYVSCAMLARFFLFLWNEDFVSNLQADVMIILLHSMVPYEGGTCTFSSAQGCGRGSDDPVLFGTCSENLACLSHLGYRPGSTVGMDPNYELGI